MFFIDNLKNITKEDELYNYIIQTQDNLQKIIEIQYTKKSTLMQILDKIANIDITKIDISNSQNMLSLIEETKVFFEEEKQNYSSFRVELGPLRSFYGAEEYHQNYLDKHPDGYCHITKIELEKVKALNTPQKSD